MTDKHGQMTIDYEVQRALAAALRDVDRPGCALEVWDFLRWRVCNASGWTDGLTLAYIGKQIGKSESSVSRAMRALKHTGAVCDTRPDERNPSRRRYQVTGVAFTRLAPGASDSCTRCKSGDENGKELAPGASHVILDDDDVLFLKRLRGLFQQQQQDSYALHPAQGESKKLAPRASFTPPDLHPVQVPPLRSLNNGAYLASGSVELAPGARPALPDLHPAQGRRADWLAEFGVADPGVIAELAALDTEPLLARLFEAGARGWQPGTLVKRARADIAPAEQFMGKAAAAIRDVGDYTAADLRAALNGAAVEGGGFFEDEFAEFISR